MSKRIPSRVQSNSYTSELSFFPPYLRGKLLLDHIDVDLNKETIQYIESRISIEGKEVFPTGNTILQWLYDVLNILDVKASALMRLNGVMLAAVALIYNSTLSGTNKFIQLGVVFCGILSIVTIGICMNVVAVSWPFLGHLDSISDYHDLLHDINEEFLKLQKETKKRESLYRVSWWVSAVNIGVLCYIFLTFLYNHFMLIIN